MAAVRLVSGGLHSLSAFVTILLFFLLVPVRKAAMNKLLKILYEILSVSATVLSVPGILFALHKVYEAWNS